MRQAPIVGGITWILAFSLTARAQPLPYEATVIVPEVEVRSGPSGAFYSTSKLHQGDKVKVLRLENEGTWLAIVPPPGSFSWINTRFLERDRQTGIVHGEDVPLRVGSALSNEPPTVERFKAKQGTPVVILDFKKMVDSDGAWLPIAPVPQEYRYIPADDVKATGPLSKEPPVSLKAQAADTGGVPAATGPATQDDQMWLQAQQAERAGNDREAIRLYEQLGKRTANQTLAINCYNRSNWLREKIAAATHYSPARPADGYYPNAGLEGRLVPTPGYPYSQNNSTYYATGRAVSQYTYAKDTGGTTSPGQPRAYGQVSPPAPAPQWSGVGRLSPATFFVDNKPTYVLQTSQGIVRLYVTPQAGLNLEPYINRTVELYGPIVYRSDLRWYYMAVSNVVLR